MFANYHTHTARCHHATGEDKAYVEAAIQNGFQVLGFSDHCPWIFSDGYVSPIRMTPDELDGYVTSLTALKKEYAADITILSVWNLNMFRIEKMFAENLIVNRIIL